MQQHLPVPLVLVQATYAFENSGIRRRWRDRDLASRGSLSVISLRIVNLRAAFKNGEIKDPEIVREMALAIDSDLEDWRGGVSSNWTYSTTAEVNASDCFNGERHVYPSIWIAEIWNNWRTLRALVNQIIAQNESRQRYMLDDTGQSQLEYHALSKIRSLSTDMCISAHCFEGNPRTYYSSLQRTSEILVSTRPKHYN